MPTSYVHGCAWRRSSRPDGIGRTLETAETAGSTGDLEQTLEEAVGADQSVRSVERNGPPLPRRGNRIASDQCLPVMNRPMRTAAVDRHPLFHSLNYLTQVSIRLPSTPSHPHFTKSPSHPTPSPPYTHTHTQPAGLPGSRLGYQIPNPPPTAGRQTQITSSTFREFPGIAD